MSKFHPDSRYLNDYATGALSQSQAVCVAAHLHYCSKCRGVLMQLNDVGASLLMELEGEEVDKSLFDTVMQKIENPNAQEEFEPVRNTTSKQLPKVVRRLVSDDIDALNWVKLGSSLKYARMLTGDSSRSTALYHIRAGGKIPSHTHQGEEITVVLKGSFSDADDRYEVGDFLVRTGEEKHQPIATQDGDCLCIATEDGPIVPTNWFFKMINPLLQRKLI